MCTTFINTAKALPRWATALGVAITPEQGSELRRQICTHSGDYYDHCGGDMEWVSEYEQELFLRNDGIESAYLVVECVHHTKVWFESRGIGLYERMSDTDFKITGAFVEIDNGESVETKRVRLSACELATFAHALGLNS